MSLDFDFDLADRTVEETESGGQPTAGFYRATIESVEEDHEKNTPATKFQFKLTAGAHTQAFNGRNIWERLWDSNSDDQSKVEMAMRRKHLFAMRLGLITEDSFGKRAQGTWLDAVGKDVIIQVVLKESEKDGQKTGQFWPQLTFSGIWSADDQDPEHLKTLVKDAAPLLTPEQVTIGQAAAAKKTTGKGGKAPAGQRQPTMAGAAAGAPSAAAGLPKDSFADF
jgi:hypothetical protein